MYGNAYKTYENCATATMSGREIEARVLSKAALKLKRCQENWNSENRRAELEEAFSYNQRIWSIFQAELSKPDHPMEKELRRSLLNLSIFIEKRIYETKAYPAPDKLTAIININNSLAAGLRKSSNSEI
ncbi:MAG: flagellar biosynthesis regulator FlaF [Thermodesulfobacteriota bacterium]|nr:flagellar biosynthesis regulator FlaF [Thermodesulfobacteriota bacterium]